MSVREEILAAAARRTRALIARDAEALRELHHPDLRFTNLKGEVRTRDAFIAGNTEGDVAWRGQTLTEVEVISAGDTAVLVARVRDELERAGEPFGHEARLTMTWVLEDGAWRVLAAHATLIAA